ncbi:AAA family ATPase [Bengtsoniella intestinalis]|uniref:ATP-dependent DNA helicase n=1 Tax=Bengtsoniella intestinalis TaxID=3073143 RepID=UPI00391F8B36
MYNRDNITLKLHREARGKYIGKAMDDIALGGDTYTFEDALLQQCLQEHPYLHPVEFREDLRWMLQQGFLQIEGRRLYKNRLLICENTVAERLATILPDNTLPQTDLPTTLAVGDTILTDEQRAGVVLALSHRLSILLGPAGSGKSTLIQAISQQCTEKGRQVLCAPTGKAARNLRDRTGCYASTIHGAVGIRPDEADVPVVWNHVPLVVIDEASMMTLEMLLWILERAPSFCRVVLVGDPHQLPSVGAGNVLSDLLTLGFPSVTLETIHRQEGGATALRTNIKRFHQLTHVDQLEEDDSFQFIQASRHEISAKLCTQAVVAYQNGASTQVLSPYNKAGALSAVALNAAIAPQVNPPLNKASVTLYQHPQLCDGDRVIITKNSRAQDCCNGDVGVLHLDDMMGLYPIFSIHLPDGRTPTWRHTGHLRHVLPAYALTVHKSQGSEYDTILFPVSPSASSMLTRNLLYTAISRAKKKVILIGDRDALHAAMQKAPPARNSKLVAKTRMLLHRPSA